MDNEMKRLLESILNELTKLNKNINLLTPTKEQSSGNSYPLSNEIFKQK